MLKKIQAYLGSSQRAIKLAIYNLSVFVFGTSLVLSGYGAYKYAETLHDTNQRLYKAAAILIVATGVYAWGKWLVNKELEVK